VDEAEWGDVGVASSADKAFKNKTALSGINDHSRSARPQKLVYFTAIVIPFWDDTPPTAMEMGIAGPEVTLCGTAALT
jgi:hypothetical protein